MTIVSFHAFVDALDASLRSFATDSSSITLEEQSATASWICEPFRAGVERVDLSVRAWVGLGRHSAHEFHEALTLETASRLGEEFAALLAGPEEEP